MNSLALIRSFCLCCTLCISCLVFCQENCDNSLKDALFLYKSGKLNEAESKLTSCVTQFKTSDQKFEGYRLLAQIYLAQANKPAMDDAIIHMLRIRPSHLKQTLGTDPKELSAEVMSFKVRPRWEAQLTAGVGVNTIEVKRNNVIFPNAITEYRPTAGFLFGLGCKRNFKKSSGIAIHGQLHNLSIDHQLKLNANEVQNFQESLGLFGLDVDYIHSWNKKGYILNGQLGMGVSSIYSSLATIQLNDLLEDQVAQQSENALTEHQTIQPRVTAGLGIQWPLLVGNIGLTIRHAYYLRTIRSSERLYDDYSTMIEREYIPDLVRLNSTLLEFSYQLPLSYNISRK